MSGVSSQIRRGFVQTVPIFIGYLPAGIAFGLAGMNAGLSVAQTVGMSLIVLGASSQFAALQLLLLATPFSVIVLSTFMINFRHLLMATSLVPSQQPWSKGEIALFSYALTDEAFAIHAKNIDDGVFDKKTALATNLFTHAAWVGSTALGVALGGVAGEHAEHFGLDFALVAMFVALFILQVKNRATLACGLFAIVLSTLLSTCLPKGLNIAVAVAAACLAGAYLETSWKTSKSGC